MKFYIFSCYIFLTTSIFSQGVNYQWAKVYGNSGDGEFRDMVVDNSGNIYSVGSFQGSVDFDPGPGTNNISIGGSAEDAFIQKLDSNGNFLWANAYFSPGGSSPDVAALAVTCDDSNNVYVVGSFIGTVDFDYGSAVESVTASSNDIFILKLDSLGNFVWVKNLGNTGATHFAQEIQYDTDGFIYTVGYHIGVIDVDPGPGVVNFTGSGGFLLKLNLDGNFVDAYQFQGDAVSSGYTRSISMAIDSMHSVYISGDMLGTVDFDPGPSVYTLTSNGSRDGFALKLDSIGNFCWAITLGSIGSDNARWISLDPNDGVFIGGVFMETVDFDTGSGMLNVASSGSTDAFVMKLDTAGNFGWVRTFGSTGQEATFSLSNDVSGNVYATGWFSDTVDFDPSAAQFNMIPDTASQMFILKLDNSGDFVWAKQFEGTLLQNGLAIHTDFTSDDILVGGQFRDFIDFDPGIGTALFTPGGERNFLLKLSQCVVSYGTDVVTSCDSYTWIDGNTYTSNNNTSTYLLSNASAIGCDSIVTLDLTILPSVSGIENVTVCDSFIWIDGNTYTSSIVTSYTFQGGAASGCDSVVTLNLTVNTINSNLTSNDPELIAQPGMNSYQWLDCNNNFAPILGETSSTFIAQQNGLYAVRIENNGCVDTSFCLPIEQVSLSHLNNLTWKIYPNPVKTELNVVGLSTNETYIIYNLQGARLFSGNTSDNINVDHLQAGTYLLKFENRPAVLFVKE